MQAVLSFWDDIYSQDVWIRCMEKPDSRQVLGREWRRLGEAAEPWHSEGGML